MERKKMMTMYISPYRRFAGLREAMDRILEESLSENLPSEREMLLAVNVHSDDEAFVITALVPGLESDDLDIEILNNTVSIRGEFKIYSVDDVKYIYNELPTGRFSRVVTLPVAADSANAEANLKDGILTLRVPKAEEHRPKAIKVKTA
jgi:HSP20 family protein